MWTYSLDLFYQRRGRVSQKGNFISHIYWAHLGKSLLHRLSCKCDKMMKVFWLHFYTMGVNRSIFYTVNERNIPETLVKARSLACKTTVTQILLRFVDTSKKDDGCFFSSRVFSCLSSYAILRNKQSSSCPPVAIYWQLSIILQEQPKSLAFLFTHTILSHVIIRHKCWHVCHY